jgi:hypothetical protein
MHHFFWSSPLSLSLAFCITIGIGILCQIQLSIASGGRQQKQGRTERGAKRTIPSILYTFLYLMFIYGYEKKKLKI